MKPGTKTLLSFLLIGSAVVVVATLQTESDSLFQGRIFQTPTTDTATSIATAQNTQLTPAQGAPDLAASIEVSPPEEGNEDIIINSTISNIGDGALRAEEGFEYTIFLNDENILSNSDSFTTLEPGDSFSFSYPAPRKIYNYPNQGIASIVVDSQNQILEKDEENNLAEAPYSF